MISEFVAPHVARGRFAGCRADWETDYCGLEVEDGRLDLSILHRQRV